MSAFRREVYVLGAGFTKAFAEDAPLLLGDYGTEEVRRFDAFPYTHAILEQERTRCPNGLMNLERLMTRLASGMPYDWPCGERDVLKGLLSALKRSLLDKLHRAKSAGNVRWDELRALAKRCLTNGIHCITFNYDDFLDHALWLEYSPSQSRIWHPHWGYGFYCNSSLAAIGASGAAHRGPVVLSMYLLKLHGSVNWRVRHGHPTPYTTDAITHFEDWWTIPEYEGDLAKHNKYLPPFVAPFLDPDPFIVPPVLSKSELVEQPVLRVIWSRAFELLEEAEKVTFVGYSLPVTDIAAGTLFREALGHLKPADVRVVDYASPDQDRAEKCRQVLESYSAVFPGIIDKQVNLGGGLEWLREECR